MNSVPQHLHTEDRQDYERLLDEALRSAPHRPELAAVGLRLNPEQLRTMALNATALITAVAATEYHHYVRVREELRFAPPPSPPSVAHDEAVRPSSPGLGRRMIGAVLGTGRPGGGRAHTSANVVVDRQRWEGMSWGRRLLAALLGLRVRPAAPVTPVTPRVRGERRYANLADVVEAEESREARAGALAAVAVLTPVLAGSAAVLFLLMGYLLKALDSASALAASLLTTGWVFGVIAAVAILVGGAGLLHTALRDARTPAMAHGLESEEVARAREAWHEALLERGIVPFLRDALADPGASDSWWVSEGPRALPAIGYERPGFSSPDAGPPAGPRPSFSSPEFTSPDFGGPEHEPE